MSGGSFEPKIGEIKEGRVELVVLKRREEDIRATKSQEGLWNRSS